MMFLFNIRKLVSITLSCLISLLFSFYCMVEVSYAADYSTETPASSSAATVPTTISPTQSASTEVVTEEPLVSVPISPTPAPQEEINVETLKENQAKTGKLSFYFQNISIRTLLQIIAKSSGMNFVISDAVKGNATLSLKDVTWEQALRTIKETYNLASQRVDNVIYITTNEEMTSNLTKKLQSKQVLSGLEPLSSTVIRLKYTDATAMADVLKGPQGSALLTQRGQVTIDPRTNSLIVVDIKSNLAHVKNTVNRLDIPARQVLIEARIVHISTVFENQLGVRFGLSDTRHLSGTLSGANQLAQGVNVADVTPFEQRLNFNIPANALSNGSTPGSIGLALARLGPVMLDLELSALESEGHIQIISRPRVITSNQQKATIQTGEEIPYQEATSSGATSISFKKAVLSLEVTPLITPNNKIILKLKATQDTRGPQLIVSPGTTSTTTTAAIPAVFGPPTINTQEVQSYILLDNNETFVVGGVFKQTKQNTVDRVPFFGSLPVVGNFFTHRGEKDERTELLIFITPKIIQPDMALLERSSKQEPFQGRKEKLVS